MKMHETEQTSSECKLFTLIIYTKQLVEDDLEKKRNQQFELWIEIVSHVFS